MCAADTFVLPARNLWGTETVCLKFTVQTSLVCKAGSLLVNAASPVAQRTYQHTYYIIAQFWMQYSATLKYARTSQAKIVSALATTTHNTSCFSK
jgi:hypothetical protein